VSHENSSLQLLLDANSLLLLARSTDEETKLKAIMSSRTLTLAFYEIGNAIWKESKLLKTLDKEEADRLAHAVSIIFSRIEIVQITRQEELEGILEIARKEKRTFYDCAYIFAAKSENLTLVTEDEKLSKIAKKYIKTRSVSSL
jgi:predicted nucleic acid-binding protein